MAEILRPNFDKLWASAGSVIEPSELKIESGWMEEVPPSQWENWIQLRQDQAIKYIFQRGIPAWDAKEEYFAGRSAVLLDGDIYIALRNNVNKSPKTNTADWRVVTKDLTIANITGLQAALNNKADKTVSITGVGGLTGGGTLAANRTIDLNAATKNSLTLADGALQKTQNLNDLPNKATARNNLGLGTAATRDVGEASGDLMEVGAFGLGGKGGRNLSGNKDFISVERSILFSHDTTNTPEDAPMRAAATGFISSVDANRSSGIWIPTSSGMSPSIMQRGSDGSVVWTNIFTEDNFNPSTKANTTTQIIAGNGLSGGGNLTTNRTLSLGTPSSVTKTSTNSVTATSHTHELSADVKNSLSLADGSLQKAQNLKDLPNVSAARHNLGLGSAATKDVGISTGMLMEVGAFGVGGDSVVVNDGSTFGSLFGSEGDDTIVRAIGKGNSSGFDLRSNKNNTNLVFRRFNSASGGWSDPYSIYHTGNFNPNTLLEKSKNLSDVTNTTQARTNLGLGSAATRDVDELYHTGNFPPIGFCYTQYPDTPTPSELFGGTWTLMFNTEGVFFRTEGQGASAFGSGVQGDAFRSHEHGIIYRESIVVASGGSRTIRGLEGGTGVMLTNGTGGDETRPRNRTVRIWRKTAH